MGEELANKVKQVTAFNLAGTVFFAGFEVLACVLVINNDCFLTNYMLALPCYPERWVMIKNASTLWRKSRSHLHFFPTVFDSCAVISYKWSSCVQFLVLPGSGNQSHSSESIIGTGFKIAWWWMKGMCLVLVCLYCLRFHFCGYLFVGLFFFISVMLHAEHLPLSVSLNITLT